LTKDPDPEEESEDDMPLAHLICKSEERRDEVFKNRGYSEVGTTSTLSVFKGRNKSQVRIKVPEYKRGHDEIDFWDTAQEFF
jgi:hypothetical protein